jgi:hypothetical protein
MHAPLYSSVSTNFGGHTILRLLAEIFWPGAMPPVTLDVRKMELGRASCSFSARNSSVGFSLFTVNETDSSTIGNPLCS